MSKFSCSQEWFNVLLNNFIFFQFKNINPLAPSLATTSWPRKKGLPAFNQIFLLPGPRCPLYFTSCIYASFTL